MKLWVDDLRPMPDGFDAHAKTAQEAIRYLETRDVKKISLDHDLGSDSQYETGYFVACWIELAAHNKWIPKLQWEVHSANPVGRRNIEMALKKADQHWESA